MEKLICSANQMLCLDKNETYRNQTISMAFKVSSHFDRDILLATINKEIERNEGLRLKASKHFFKWHNSIREPYTIKELNSIDVSSCSDEQIRERIDEACGKDIVFKTGTSFAFYHFIGKDGDYLLLRVLHVYMDAYSVLLTSADILKVYYALLNKTEMPTPLSSVRDFLKDYENNLESINTKIKEDTNYFIDKNKQMGEPTFMGIEGGYNGENKRFKMNIFKPHPCQYYETKIDQQLASALIAYCKDKKLNIVSLFLGALELYSSGINDGYKDISLFFTTDSRAKLVEKSLPLTNSTAIFFRRLLDDNLSFEEFFKECDKDYLANLRKAHASIGKIYQYLIGLNLLDINGRYDQLVCSFIPVNFEGIAQNITIDPYWPKDKNGPDFIIYNIVVPNKDGSFNVFYRYFTEFIKEEDVKNLHKGIEKIFKKGLQNPEIKISDILKMVK